MPNRRGNYMEKLKIGTKLYSLQEVDSEDERKFKLVEATIYSATESVQFRTGEVYPMQSVLKEGWENTTTKEYALVDSLNINENGQPEIYVVGHLEIQGSEEAPYLIEWFFDIDDCLEFMKQKFLDERGNVDYR